MMKISLTSHWHQSKQDIFLNKYDTEKIYVKHSEMGTVL